jgi:hypothetical protein
MATLSEKSQLLGNRSSGGIPKSETKQAWRNYVVITVAVVVVMTMISNIIPSTIPFERAESAESTAIISVHYNHILNNFEVRGGRRLLTSRMEVIMTYCSSGDARLFRIGSFCRG